jgi:hypothetical protein
VVPVVVGRALPDVRPARVVVDEGAVAVGVGVVEPVELGERHGLDHGEALPRPVLEIAVRLLAVQAVDELPRRVAEVEERPAVLVDEEAPVLAHLQAWHRSTRRRRGECGEEEESERYERGQRTREAHEVLRLLRWQARV